jgi:DNA repair protein SbcD/Mre11
MRRARSRNAGAQARTVLAATAHGTAQRMQTADRMRLLHVADVHLEASYSGFGELARERAREVCEAFRRLPDAAAEARADAVLVAGDLFDGPHPGTDALTAVRDAMKGFVDLCIPVFLVPGNHDAITLKLNPYRELARGPRVVVQNGEPGGGRRWPVTDEEGRRLAEKHSIYLLARPRLGDPVTVETASGPLHVYGAAYDPAEAPDPTAAFRRRPAEGVHVVLLHAYVRGLERRPVDRNALTLDLGSLDGLDVDYIALGDQHRTLLPADFGGRPACYPGSFAATDPIEVGPRGYVLVEIEPGSAPTIQHRDAGVRPALAVEVDVSSCVSDEEVSDSATRRIHEGAVPVVRLVGEPTFPVDADQVTAMLVAHFGHALVTDDTRYYAAPRLAELAESDSVAGHVVRLARERAESAASGPEREAGEQALRVVLRALEVA